MLAKVTQLGQDLEAAAKSTDPAFTSKLINKAVNAMAEDSFEGVVAEKLLSFRETLVAAATTLLAVALSKWMEGDAGLVKALEGEEPDKEQAALLETFIEDIDNIKRVLEDGQVGTLGVVHMEELAR
eukprot:3923685-Lingulodinium_polyedra.AAC.1